PVAIAQLLFEKLGTQVLHQFVAVLAALPLAARPGVAEGTGELPHHLPQRHLLAEERHLLVGDTGAGGQVDTRLRSQVVAEVGERRRLKGKAHLLREASIDYILPRFY